MHRAESAYVITAEFLRATLESLAGAKANELLKRRIEIGLAPDQKIEPLHDERREFELELTRARLDAETHIGPAGRDGQSEIGLCPLDGLDPPKIRRLKPLPLEQDCEHQFAGGLLLARLKTKAARGGERID
jgi:hypothetical protein